jgi:hypothetical protein
VPKQELSAYLLMYLLGQLVRRGATGAPDEFLMQSISYTLKTTVPTLRDRAAW